MTQEMKLGMIASYEPSDRYEWGVVYDVDGDGQGGWAAFLDQCSSWDSLSLRRIERDGDRWLVRDHYDTKLREAEVHDFVPSDNHYEPNEEQSLAQVLKIAAMHPKTVEVYMDYIGDRVPTARDEQMELAHLRKSLYDMLASDDCLWLRLLWPKLPSSWEDIEIIHEDEPGTWHPR